MVKIIIKLTIVIAIMNLFNCADINRFGSDIEIIKLLGVDQQFERRGDSVFIYVPNGTDVTNLKTEITLIDRMATISPVSGSHMDFSTPKEFIVKGRNQEERKILVTVKISQWKQVLKNGEAPFLRVDGHQLVVFKDKMWLLGGWLGKYGRDKIWTSQVWCTSDGKNWESKGDAPWAGRHGFGCVVYDDKIWVIGGDQNTDVWNTEDGMNWNKILDKVPWGERYFPYIASFKGKIWVMGGVHIDFSAGNEMREKYNDVWSTIDGVNWVREVEFAKWVPRGLITGQAFKDDALYIYGGCILYSYAFNDVWKTTNGIEWTKMISHAPWPPRQWCSIANFKNKLWIMAGDFDVRQDSMLNDVWYSRDGESWTEQKGIFWEPRHATPVIEFKDKLWLIGGLISRNDGGVANDVWVLDLDE